MTEKLKQSRPKASRMEEQRRQKRKKMPKAVLGHKVAEILPHASVKEA